MSINFNSLPDEKPSLGTVIPKGQYVGIIKKAEMKQGKDETKPPYLNLTMEIVDDASGTNMGTMWVILTESEAPLPRYQLSRFIKALGLPITGEFELKDLTKMVVNKKLIVDVTPEERSDGKAPQRSVVDIDAEIFYPIEPVSEVQATPMDSTPFEADAMPTPPPTATPQPATMSQY